MSKKVIIPTLTLLSFMAVGLLGSQVIKADDTDPASSPVVARLAETFNLDESEVQAVFEAVRDEKRDEMEKRREQRLSDAVTDGVITEEQKQAILDRQETMQQEREQNREDLQAWFTEQGIDAEALQQYMGFGPHGGPGFHGGPMMPSK